MKIVAVGAGEDEVVWKGVAVELGSESRSTLTGRCKRRDSVKNLDCQIRVSRENLRGTA